MPKQATNGATPLVAQLTSQILAFVRESNAEPGSRLAERALAERFNVSRSPVRRALQELVEQQLIAVADSGGFVVTEASFDAPPPERVPEFDELYLRIAQERLDGLLPERVTENALMRRYDVTRAQLAQVLRRISNEGWILDLPGYGWQFQETLTSIKSYADSYRFRQLVEPAAILQPGYAVDVDALRARRDEQQALIDGRIHEVTGSELFELNSAFHEVVTAGTGNEFFMESLSRINRLRRLIEYRQALVPERAAVRCAEHVRLADLLLDGNLEEASSFLAQHLSTVGEEKTGSA
ncbi:DNA-binding GntR family transcriptional regulator [Pseudoclavibacter sp. JAI123]|uniref:GntR family transcriptional regulator n=1 Tax=Pseudoclavibacter sp. JAI123 TaxID=2723065 RepID=UPI0015CE4301|nr:GntR family transcriptional regulator [Pseudoclavibacter sp. JAI123]NYF14806.1 DNA-binding GntR family transcriptional regulator [Pseudoclavibacter sp. JAI123]